MPSQSLSLDSYGVTVTGAEDIQKKNTISSARVEGFLKAHNQGKPPLV